MVQNDKSNQGRSDNPTLLFPQRSPYQCEKCNRIHRTAITCEYARVEWRVEVELQKYPYWEIACDHEPVISATSYGLGLGGGGGESGGGCDNVAIRLANVTAKKDRVDNVMKCLSDEQKDFVFFRYFREFSRRAVIYCVP
ncbi:MAG: hypothetical protein ACYDG6_06815 [Thermincolia bacterium]